MPAPVRTSILGTTLTLLTLAAGCARTGVTAEPQLEFQGTWSVTELTVDDTDFDVETEPVVIDIDTTTYTLEAVTGCRRLLGSYTLTDDHVAGFSLPGGTLTECPDDTRPEVEAVDGAIVDAAAGLERWGTSSGPNGSRNLELTGPGVRLVLNAPELR